MNELDQLVMLLSTDWFLNFWSLLGLKESTKVKELIQKEARNIVRQILGSSTSYWNISFTPIRLVETKCLFQTCLVKARATKQSIDQLISLADMPTDRQRELQSAYMATREMAIYGQLSPEAMQKINTFWDLTNSEIDTLESAFSSPRTSWDNWIVDLTDDLPSFLLDHALILSKIGQILEFWQQLASADSSAVRIEYLNILCSIEPKLKKSVVLSECFRTNH